jgi:hypothetical protein
VAGKKYSAESCPNATAPNTNPACVDQGVNMMKARRMLILHNGLRCSQLACSVDFLLNSVRLHYLANTFVMEKTQPKIL